MANWDEGDICEVHDIPDECDEFCNTDILDYYDEGDTSDEWDVYPYNVQKH